MTVASTTPQPAEATEPADLILVGVDFRTAPLELREQIARDRDGVESLLVALLARPEIDEAFVLSTCNRTEAYIRPVDELEALHTALELTFGNHRGQIESEGRFFVLRDSEAAKHLLDVASGLESMVLGEPEILGQVKQAGETAEGAGSLGEEMRRLVRRAVAAGRRVRSETEIGSGAVSLGYAVVELAKQIFTRLDSRRAAILGAGETARLALTALSDRGVEAVIVNRSLERAEELADRFPGATVRPFDERYEVLDDVDIVVATTSASEPVLTIGPMREAMKRRERRSLLAVDLGVPRNVDQAVGHLGNLFLHDVDSLRLLIDRNLEARRKELPRAETIVESELAVFVGRRHRKRSEPVVAQLQRWADRVRRRELERARDRFPAETHDDLDRLTRALVKKLLHHPSSQIRRGDDATEERLQAVRSLFRLDEVDTGEDG